MPTFGERLKELRLEKQLTQNELGRVLQLSKNAITMYEKGDRMAKYEKLEEIADFFNVDINYLMGKTHYKTKYDWHHEINQNSKEDTLLNLTASCDIEENTEELISTLSKLDDNKVKAVTEFLKRVIDIVSDEMPSDLTEEVCPKYEAENGLSWDEFDIEKELDKFCRQLLEELEKINRNEK